MSRLASVRSFSITPGLNLVVPTYGTNQFSYATPAPSISTPRTGVPSFIFLHFQKAASKKKYTWARISSLLPIAQPAKPCLLCEKSSRRVSCIVGLLNNHVFNDHMIGKVHFALTIGKVRGCTCTTYGASYGWLGFELQQHAPAEVEA